MKVWHSCIRFLELQSGILFVVLQFSWNFSHETLIWICKLVSWWCHSLTTPHIFWIWNFYKFCIFAVTITGWVGMCMPVKMVTSLNAPQKVEEKCNDWSNNTLWRALILIGDFRNVFKCHAYSCHTKGCSWRSQSLLDLAQPSNN